MSDLISLALDVRIANESTPMMPVSRPNAVQFIADYEKAVATEARHRGVDGVVCGHIHHAEMRDIDGVLYANDGDWVESLTALVEPDQDALAVPREQALAFKLDSAMVPGLPKPLPWREIFVYSPRVEGVHLRFGPVARGGLRWSDRREDFRAAPASVAKMKALCEAYEMQLIIGQVTGFGLSDTREIYAVTYGGGLYKVGFGSV